MPQMAQMRQAARMFYKDKLSKTDIAQRFDVDPRKITWLLEQAEQFGIVKITVEETGGSDLEEPLREKFPHLQRVLIVSGPKVETVEQYQPVFLSRAAQVAADYFDELVEAQEQKSTRPFRAVISGGESWLEFSNAVKDRPRKNLCIHVAGLIGHGRVGSAMHIDPIVNSSVLWSHSGRIAGRCIYSTVPPFNVSKPGPKARKAAHDQVEELALLPPVRDGLADVTADKIDVALAGIGLVDPAAADSALRDRISSTVLLRSIVRPARLAKEGAIGEISYCHFNENGEDPDNQWRFFLTAGECDEDPKRRGLGFYKAMTQAAKPVIAIAGPYKLDPIKAALKGKLINILITDEHTAREIIEGS
jgi:DNA-binding transcriptional regulator LsrR (DeoR family)